MEEDRRWSFARAVIDRLDGPILRYAQRLELQRLAARLGIPAFDASLIIAQVQHRAGSTAIEPQALSRAGRTAPALFAAAVQLLILCAAWALFGS